MVFNEMHYWHLLFVFKLTITFYITDYVLYVNFWDGKLSRIVGRILIRNELILIITTTACKNHTSGHKWRTLKIFQSNGILLRICT